MAIPLGGASSQWLAAICHLPERIQREDGKREADQAFASKDWYAYCMRPDERESIFILALVYAPE
jgi:hypothetical protein